MVKIISQRERKWKENVTHDFSLREDLSGGYEFDIDETGNPIFRCKEAKENYEYCISHPELFYDNGIKDRGWWYTEPAHAICNKCGREIILDGDTECECGQWYNGFGQELLPPEHWYDEEDYYDDVSDLTERW